MQSTVVEARLNSAAPADQNGDDERPHPVVGYCALTLSNFAWILHAGRKPGAYNLIPRSVRTFLPPYAVCLAFGLDALRRDVVLVGGIGGRGRGPSRD